MFGALTMSLLQLVQSQPRLLRLGLIATIFVLLLSLLLLSLLQDGSSGIQTALFKPGRTSKKGYELLDHVYNSTLGFEKLFAINLPERTDHLDGLNLASAVSGLEFEFIHGVHGDTVSEKALPADYSKKLKPAQIGSWRAHLNAIREVVHRGLSSALIVEDDVDWDIRLKDLMKDMALSSNAAINSAPGKSLEFHNLPKMASTLSPYGDGWDLLWLGHCGMKMNDEDSRVVHENDASVPEPRYLKSFDANEIPPLSSYPNHTRVVTVPKQGTCSLAYAVSQAGARKMLLNMGLQRLDRSFDLMLRRWCEGTDDGGMKHKCLGVLPQLFDHYRRRGPLTIDSDISRAGNGTRDSSYTLNIRWSVRMNMEKILLGETDYEDQYPDT